MLYKTWAEFFQAYRCVISNANVQARFTCMVPVLHASKLGIFKKVCPVLKMWVDLEARFLDPAELPVSTHLRSCTEHSSAGTFLVLWSWLQLRAGSAPISWRQLWRLKSLLTESATVISLRYHPMVKLHLRALDPGVFFKVKPVFTVTDKHDHEDTPKLHSTHSW